MRSLIPDADACVDAIEAARGRDKAARNAAIVRAFAISKSVIIADRALYPDVPVPKAVWQWVESAQYRLLRIGAHRALSTIDRLICATAALRGVVVLHDDNDFVTAARHLTDLTERRVHGIPNSR